MNTNVNIEHEKRFLVNTNSWYDPQLSYQYIIQGYLNPDIRIRIVDNNCGFITIKKYIDNTSRREYEYQIPLNDCYQLLDDLCYTTIIEKKRYLIKQQNLTWEINQYCKDNAPLVVAELEVDNIDVFNQIQLPSWINQDVTNDKRYLNYNLSINPYNSWK